MPKHPQYLWRDPFEQPSSGAVLLSDQIHFLADEVGLIDPFHEKHLRPAAYDLSVGDTYYVNELAQDALKKPIEIPPNGLVYIKTKEKFNVPYYLVARYSLCVHQVYRGLLIDNGLHIDPGYCGHIWIPVHNFTTQPRFLAHGQEFISVEFNRTTHLPREVNTIESEDELVSRGIKNELRNPKQHAIKVFYKDLDRYSRRHEDFTPRLFWDRYPGERHESAMLGTEQRLDKVKLEAQEAATQLRKEVEGHIGSFRKIGFLAAVGLMVALLGIILPIFYAEYGKSREVEAQHGAEIKDLHDRLQEQKNRLDEFAAGQSAPKIAPAAKANRQPQAK